MPPESHPADTATTVSAKAAHAVARIAPVWPLSRFVAVNPFHGLTSVPFPRACALLRRTTGAAPLLSSAEYLALYDAGEITDADLAAAAPEHDPATLRETLRSYRDAAATLETLAEFADREAGRSHWQPFITDEISRWCGTYFDVNQTTWTAPGRDLGPYASWRETAAHDLNPEVFGLRSFRATIATLPEESSAALAQVMTQLEIPTEAITDLAHRELLTVAGWAGYLQHLAHEAQLRGESALPALELLTVRLAFDLALWKSGRITPAQKCRWLAALGPVAAQPADPRSVWQVAYERHYQVELASALAPRTASAECRRANAQAVFCIDVRSEPLRRHVETAAPDYETVGFAGFFGFALRHEEADGGGTTARCPALIAPSVETATAARNGSDRFAQTGAVKAIQNSAASTFTYVETCGVGLLPALLGTAMPRAKPRCAPPALRRDFPLEQLPQLTELAAGALRGMSLRAPYARLVLLCGHGSRSTNNPHAASLACGACGGHAGDVNARFAAAVFNHPDIRRRLAARGLPIPADTWFIAGIHDTMTDDVHLFDPTALPETHRTDLLRLERTLAAASAAARRERFGANAAPDDQRLRRELERRAADPGQVRPEWGLANNAALIVARRSRTRGLTLGGRVFLQEYDEERDVSGEILRVILSAPVVVAAWINLQYYASRVDHPRYGAGSKVLHNVIGGIGVIEGNGGDLRVGLPLQSLHDGEQFVHEPRRLGVYIEASRARLDAALAALPSVRALFENGWIHLLALEGAACFRRTTTDWERVDEALDPLAEPVVAADR